MNGLTPRRTAVAPQTSPRIPQRPAQAVALQTSPPPQQPQSPPPAPKIDNNRIYANRLNDQLTNLEERATALASAIEHLYRQESATLTTLASDRDAQALPLRQNIKDYIVSFIIDKRAVVGYLTRVRNNLDFLNNSVYRLLLSDYQNLDQEISTLTGNNNFDVLLKLGPNFQERLNRLPDLLNRN